jgi:S-adenosylmethionine:tRNA ribosyltransferase-isomerase
MDVAEFDFDLPDELVAQQPPLQRGGSRLLVVDRGTDQLRDSTFAALPRLLTPGDLLVLNNTRVFPARLLGHRVPSGGAVEVMLLRQVVNAQFPTPNSQGANPESRGWSRGRHFTDSERHPPPPDEALHEVISGQLDPAASGERRPVGSWELEVGSSQVWDALVHPGQKLKPGARLLFADGDGVRLHGAILARHFHGRRTVRLWREDGGPVAEAIDRLGHIPLPPYIKRDDAVSDRERYQTVYARHRGSVAAPTAGLHFTPDLLEELAARGIERTEITLHVGYGTFKPVRVDRVEDHVVDAEAFTVPEDAADAITRALRENRRVISVGTTTTRALESLTVDSEGRVHPSTGTTRLFIHPGHRFAIVRGLVTNFHLPRSSLLMLVAAFGGRDRVLAAYRHAVAERYRFYSYGDAMLIL